MANDDRRDDAARAQQAYILYAAGGRVYASNVDQKLIDLGALAREDGGSLCYWLDGNHEGGKGFSTEKDALRDIARHLGFLWLDGQFTAVADTRATVNLDGATQLAIVLDELKPGEPAFDATV